MKYIDADLLRKDIEFAKSVYDNPKRVVHGVADAFRQDGRVAMCDDILKKIDSLQQEQPELPPIGYAETYYQKGLREGIIKGRMEILNVLGEIEKRKAEPVLVIKEQEQPEVDLVTEYDEQFDSDPVYGKLANRNAGIAIARHFYELGLNARKEDE